VKTQQIVQKVRALLTVAILSYAADSALAEVRTITATGEYRMGDNDTRTDAKRLALLDAKRLALEQAGVYIESITEVKNLDLAKEEIRAYTAGIVEVVELTTRTVMESESTVVRVDVTAKIDTDVVTRQIEALRQNQDVKSKLLAAEFRAHKLQEELAAKTRELAAAKSKPTAETVTRQRQQLMTQADVEILVARARVILTGAKANTLLVGTSTPESRKYARSLLERALAYDPENMEAQGLLGFVQFEEGQREKAISTFRDIAKKEPLSAQAHLNLGRVLQATGDYVNALKEYETAIKVEPNHAEAHASLGDSLIFIPFLLETGNLSEERRQEWRIARQNMLDRGIEHIREAIRLAPRNAEYHRQLGDALYSRLYLRSPYSEGPSKRDLDEALTELRGAVALDPSNAVLHKALAERLGGEEAKAAYRTAASLDPKDVFTRIDLGTLLLNDNDVNGAMAEFQAAVRIDPKNEKAHLRLGTALEKLGQMDKAIEEYRTAVSLGPEVQGPALSYRVQVLAEALAKVGKRKEAGQVIRDYLTLEPDGGPTGESFFRERLQELDRE
jgi:tetratricopeptide (TPR) repeat protein